VPLLEGDDILPVGSGLNTDVDHDGWTGEIGFSFTKPGFGAMIATR
jgi:hypothetical protein